MIGRSLRFVQLMTTVDVAERATGEPLSVTCIVNVNVGVTSKFKAAGSATVIGPEMESPRNAPLPFPSIIS